MKTLAILAALAAITMTASATAAPAAHQAGGPLKQGKFCWVGTGIHGTGWWDLCDPKSAMPRALSMRGRSDADIEATFNGGGGAAAEAQA